MYHNYNPYLLLSLLATYYGTRPFLGAEKTQKYLSISNTYLTIFAYLPFCYCPAYQTQVYSALFQFSTAYFIIDSYLILVHNRKQWIFLLHHAATLWLLLNEYQIPHLHLKMPVYFYLELSNAFLTFYELYHTKPMKKLLTAYYVPYRLVLVPYYGTQILLHTITTLPHASLPILSLTLMSIGYALKLAYSTPLPYLSLFPIYLHIELLYHILPHTQTHPHYYLAFIPYSFYCIYQTTRSLTHKPCTPSPTVPPHTARTPEGS